MLSSVSSESLYESILGYPGKKQSIDAIKLIYPYQDVEKLTKRNSSNSLFLPSTGPEIQLPHPHLRRGSYGHRSSTLNRHKGITYKRNLLRSSDSNGTEEH